MVLKQLFLRGEVTVLRLKWEVGSWHLHGAQFPETSRPFSAAPSSLAAFLGLSLGLCWGPQGACSLLLTLPSLFWGVP